MHAARARRKSAFHLHQVTDPGIAHLRRMVEEDVREAHIPAQRPSPSQEARLPGSHVDPRCACCPQEPSRQGSRPPLGLITSIRTRAAFEHLARHGTRIRRSELWCHWCPDPTSTTTSVAYALGRALGPATQRNRLRRRLRVILRSLEPQLPSGWLLIGARPAAVELTFDQLTQQLTQLIAALPPRAASNR